MTARLRLAFALAPALAAAAGLAACSNVSDRLTPADANIWRPGVTTEAKMLDLLGPPAERSLLPDGNVIEFWRGLVGVRTRERVAYGYVFSPRGLLVRRATRAETHAPGL